LLADMPSLLLVRHAQASFGAAHYDVLSDTGHQQAEALALEVAPRRLAVTRMVAGGLVRQQDTIAPLARALELDIATDRRWDEYDADDILSTHSTTMARQERPEGTDAPQISSREFQDLLEDALLAWIEAGTESPTREPWPVFAARVEAALRDAAEGLGPDETAIVCTSGGVLAAAAVALMGVEPAALMRFNRVAVNAGVSKVASGRSGMTLLSYNEDGHLDLAGSQLLLTYR
jgi:broad specificity phosphatase PhoE